MTRDDVSHFEGVLSRQPTEKQAVECAASRFTMSAWGCMRGRGRGGGDDGPSPGVAATCSRKALVSVRVGLAEQHYRSS